MATGCLVITALALLITAPFAPSPLLLIGGALLLSVLGLVAFHSPRFGRWLSGTQDRDS